MPVVLENIRPLNGSFTISFTFTYSIYTNINIIVSVATAPYKGTNTILAAINTSVGNAIVPYGSLTINFTVSTGAAGLQVRQILTNATIFDLYQSTLATMIEFLYNINNVALRTTTTGILKGTGPINVLGIDTCIYMQITNLPIVNNNNNISQATLKFL